MLLLGDKVIKFKNIPDYDKPRERLFMKGAESLSNEELLAIIIKTGTRKYSVKEVALRLLSEIGDLSRLAEIGINSLMNIEGIGRVKAIELKAVCELAKRINNISDRDVKIVFDNALVVYQYFNKMLVDKKQEFFYCLYLDTKKRLIECKCLFVGTINMSVVSPREVFKEAYLLSASVIICVHNHPSGDSSPSKQDREITRRLREIGVVHGVEIIDHIIIGKNNYFSFFENNTFWVSNS